MTHPMSMPWLDWRPISEEPNGYEVVLYIDENEEIWTGNHPEGCARGLWYKNAGGQSDGRKDPMMWARIPRPQS